MSDADCRRPLQGWRKIVPPDPIAESAVTSVSGAPRSGKQGRSFDLKSKAPDASFDGTYEDC